MDTKPWYKSKTMWLNIAAVVAAAPFIPEVAAIIPDSWVRPVAAAVALINLALRFNGAQSVPLTMRKGIGQ